MYSKSVGVDLKLHNIWADMLANMETQTPLPHVKQLEWVFMADRWKESGETLFVHIQQKDVKLYLVLILFSPLHLSWGIGQVLWTFIKLVLHSVDGMATGEEKEETRMLNIVNVCTHMYLHVGYLKFETHVT